MTTPVAEQNCANCYFSRVAVYPRASSDGRSTDSSPRRFCHFNPPPPPADEIRHSAGWRAVADTEWCGYWSEDASKNVFAITFPQAITGPTGPAGPQGDRGDTGPSGVSAQAIYVNDTITPANEGDLSFVGATGAVSIWRWTSGAWVAVGTISVA